MSPVDISPNSLVTKCIRPKASLKTECILAIQRIGKELVSSFTFLSFLVSSLHNSKETDKKREL